MTGERGRGIQRGQGGSSSQSREYRAPKRANGINGTLLHMAHNGIPRLDDTEDSDRSEGDSRTAEEVARLQRVMDERVNSLVETRLREERARLSQGVSTPRRAGPPAPVTPASAAGKRVHSLVQRMWDQTERHTRSMRMPWTKRGHH